MKSFIWVCIGSAAGGGARHLLYGFTIKTWGGAVPLATLAVNLIGSFLLAVVAIWSDAVSLSPTVRLALTAGVLGGFTTYSTFSYETFRYLQAGARGPALLYLLLTVVGSLAACALGWLTARWLLA